MLVLGQKIGQQINVEHKGETLTLTLLRAKGSSARVGFECPESFVIKRDDINPVEPYNAVNDE